MGLYFKNKTNEFVWVAYAYHAPGCEGGVNWAKKGWWQIPPGMTKKVHSGYVGGQKFFFFAEADDFSPAWAGSFFTHLPWSAFDWCWTTCATPSGVLTVPMPKLRNENSTGRLIAGASTEPFQMRAMTK